MKISISIDTSNRREIIRKPNPWIRENLALTTKAFKACSILGGGHSLQYRFSLILKAFGADVVWRFSPTINRFLEAIHKNPMPYFFQYIPFRLSIPLFKSFQFLYEFILLTQADVYFLLDRKKVMPYSREQCVKQLKVWIGRLSSAGLWKESLNGIDYLKCLFERGCYRN